MDEQRLKILLDKQQQGELTHSEENELNDWFHSLKLGGVELKDHIKSIGGENAYVDKRFLEFKTRIDRSQAPYRFLFPGWVVAAAASIVLIVGAGVVFIALHNKTASQQFAVNRLNDVAPGHKQATLILSNGKAIVLTKGLSGMLAKQGSTQIAINGQSAIAYVASGRNSNSNISYNTLSTAIGEESPYPLILSDGTKVWLNARSSITFPTVFNGKERIVKITGEAMFEVAHNAKQPFKVQTDKQTIEDIGTTFDVNAYADEPATETTLIEGKVKVNAIFLEPGQQSDGSHVKTVNTKRYVAWKNGDFYFEDDNIQTIMRQLSRWYNIDVKYEGNIPTGGFDAQMSREKNISAILNILENTKGVHFKIEGRRVTVIE